uniref:Odorant receptor n=1 Tax=Heortia vitessoides TaxID=1557813 RepID=A0A978W717_9NEOP|nr:odorant receptor 15 [Heortia vitessoides]
MWRSIRKYGLEYCDLPTMLSNLYFMFRPLTLNIDPGNTEPIPKVFFVITLIFAIIYTYTYFFSMIWFVFVRCIETRDLVAAMIVFSLGITSEIGVTKYIFTLAYENKIRGIIKQYIECDALVVAGSRFSKNLLKALRNVKQRAVVYWIVIISNGIIYIMKPFVMPGRNPMEEIFILYKLEPPLEKPNLELANLMMALGSVFTCYLTANMAVFLIIISGYVEAQLLALSVELENIWDDAEVQHTNDSKVEDSTSDASASDSPDNNAINKIIGQRLCELIKVHAININLLLEIEVVFRGAFIVEFIVLSVGLIAQLLGGLQNTYMEVPFAVIQVAMDCLTGQRLMDACDVFEVAVYGCKWERYNASNMKTVLMMLMNSQKTLTLTAGGVAVLNFACLMSVFNSVYSAFTTLQSVM